MNIIVEDFSKDAVYRAKKGFVPVEHYQIKGNNLEIVSEYEIGFYQGSHIILKDLTDGDSPSG